MRDSILNSGYVQFRVKCGEVDENLASLRQGLAAISPPANALLVLPEMWSCGFDYPRMAEHAERTPELLLELAKIARERGISLAGSMPEAGDGRIYNTFYLVGPEGVAGAHRKSRLFGPMGEDRFFTPGPPPHPWETSLGLVAPLVCFELRFPELARGTVAEGAEIIVVAAQWPRARIGQWRLLLKARAVENQVFVIAANGCGRGDDEPGGNSLVIGPDGSILAEADNSPAGAVAALDRKGLAAIRQRFSTVARPGPRPIEKKIVPAGNIKEALVPYRRNGGKVVFTNGCFDILHPGHVTYLEEARGMGDCLVVGLNSDASVRRLKGASRPVNDQAGRARVLAGLACVDFVVIFEEDTPLELIKVVGPDILVKGGDWPVERIVGAAEVQAAGGRVLSIPLVGDHSTTGIINEIKERYEG